MPLHLPHFHFPLQQIGESEDPVSEHDGAATRVVIPYTLTVA